MDTFKASDVYEIAVQIESNGEKLYRHAVNVTDDSRMKELFTYLADEEVKHMRLFEGLGKKVEQYNLPETYDGEYCSYVRSYSEGLVFTPEKMEKELAKVKSAEDAIEFGIQREIESSSLLPGRRATSSPTARRRISTGSSTRSAGITSS